MITFSPSPPLPHISGMELALKCAKEFVCATKVFSFLTLTLVSLEMINALLFLHPLNTYSACFDSLLDF